MNAVAMVQPQVPSAGAGGRERTKAGTAVLWLMAGLALLDRPFGLIAIPGTPIYVTEVVLALGLVLMVTRRDPFAGLFSTAWTTPVLIAAYMGWGLIRLLGSLGNPALEAIRDSALVYYSLFALIAFVLARFDERFTPANLLEVYGRFVPVFLVVAPIRLVFSAVVPALSTIPPTIPGSDVTLFGGHRPGNLGVHTAIAVVYLASSGKRDRATSRWIVCGLLSLGLVATQNRGGLLAACTVIAVAAVVWHGSIRLRVGKAAAVFLAAVVLAWGLNLRITAGTRELSVNQLLSNLQSLVGKPSDSAASNLENTVDFRVTLWNRVYAATVHNGYLANGWGFGENLGYRFLPGTEDKQLRNPHNSHLTILVRLGVVGFMLWFGMLATWYAAVLRRAWAAGRTKAWLDPERRLALMLVAAMAGILVNAFVDPTLETPMAAVWLWMLIGLGLHLVTRTPAIAGRTSHVRNRRTAMSEWEGPIAMGAAGERTYPLVDVLSVPVTATTLSGAVDRVERWIGSRTPGYVTFTGVHGVMECQSDSDLLAIHQQAAMVCADGMPMVWAAKSVGYRDVTRVYGPDFMLEMSARAAEKGYRYFFYGGKEGVAEQLAASLQARYPGLQVVGSYCPPFRALTPEEKAEVVERITASGADLVWVGLSTPKQERWMAEFCPVLDGPVLLGVGAAFDIHSGNLRQAPMWIRKRGFEWLYRLLMEPRRLWKRYLSNNPRFAWAILRRRPRRAHGMNDDV
ncbi:MAG: WecB/TagA/CpsF family glycosyltransferase [Acidimicrobiia bacterium]